MSASGLSVPYDVYEGSEVFIGIMSYIIEKPVYDQSRGKLNITIKESAVVYQNMVPFPRYLSHEVREDGVLGVVGAEGHEKRTFALRVNSRVKRKVKRRAPPQGKLSGDKLNKEWDNANV